jgi:orotate phosphoribosyltransferase
MVGQCLPEDLLAMWAPRRGHFRLESGHHGDLWLEVARPFLQPRRMRLLAALLAQRLAPHEIAVVCGPMVEGALLGQMVAEELGAELVVAQQVFEPARDGLHSVGYRIPEAIRRAVRARRVAVVDDVINAGSAVRGAFVDLVACGALPVALGSLLVLGQSGPEFAASQRVAIESLAAMPNAIWDPAECPQCAAGVPLES